MENKNRIYIVSFAILLLFAFAVVITNVFKPEQNYAVPAGGKVQIMRTIGRSYPRTPNP